MKKTKLVCSIGPSSASLENLRKLIENGMNVARFDLGKVSYHFCEETVDKIHSLELELEKTISIMFDNRGIELRVGALGDGKVFLKAGKEVEIWNNSIVGTEDKFSIFYPELLRDIRVGMTILLSSSKVILKVIEKYQEYFVAVVEQEGFIYSHDTVHIPKITLSQEYLDMKNRDDVRFAIKENVDFLALSFLRNSNDILDVTDLLIEEGNDHIQLIAKIENELCLDDLDRMIELSDGVMIARGDLGEEMPFEKVPHVQKMVMKKVRNANKIGLISTDILASMIERPVPTRAEVEDIYNSVLDGCDAICLNLETSIGAYPIEVVEVATKILEQAESDMESEKQEIYIHEDMGKDVTSSLAYSAYLTANHLKAKFIVTETLSGYTAKKLSRLRANAFILAFSKEQETIRSLTLHYGVVPILMYQFNQDEEFVSFYKEQMKKYHILKKGDDIVILGAVKSEGTNMMRVEEWKS